MTTHLGIESLEDLATGAAFLATGGGGDPYLALLAARRLLAETGPVRLLKAAALADDAHVVAVGGVGAPTVGLELLPAAGEAAAALQAYEEHSGRQVDAVVAFEIGGGNSLAPLMAAAGSRIPVIDGDGMGRALPEAQMMSFAIAGVAPTPAVGLDYAGNVLTFKAATAADYEREVRQAAQERGGLITTVEHPMSGWQLKSCIMADTVSFAVRLGTLLRQRRGDARRLAGPLRELFRDSIYGGVHHLYTGKVTAHSTTVKDGYDIGETVIEAFDGGGAPESAVALSKDTPPTGAASLPTNAPPLTIAIKNEYLAASLGDEVIASVPDLIVVLDQETATPINAERLRYGQRVTVYGIGCPAFYRHPSALAAVAPHHFGFNFNHRPLPP